MALFDRVLGYARIIKAAVVGDRKAIVFNLVDIESDDGEQASIEDQIAYGQGGAYFRPDPPDDEGEAEAITMRTEDGTPVIATRDLRLSNRVNPKDGELGLAHYGGGYLSFGWNDNRDGTLIGMIAPKLNAEGSGGTIQQAHGLVFDPGAANYFSLVHASGHGMIATGEGLKPLVLKNATGDNLLELNDDQIKVQGQSYFLSSGKILIYCPNGAGLASTKAHAIELSTGDGNSGTLTIAHAEGQYITMGPDGSLLLASDTAVARIFMKGDELTIQANKININGNVGLGPAPTLPLAAGAASQAAPAVFL